MPELIRRGFDKIVWDTTMHNKVKLDWFHNHNHNNDIIFKTIILVI